MGEQCELGRLSISLSLHPILNIAARWRLLSLYLFPTNSKAELSPYPRLRR